MLRSLAVVALSTLAIVSTSVAANGYWEYKTVCEYETTYEVVPYTQCNYRNWEHGKSDTSILSEHVSCPSSKYSSVFINVETCKWEWQGQYPNQKYVKVCTESQQFSNLRFDLLSTNHFEDVSAVRKQIPGSCKEEKVWIELCKNCSIP